MNTTYRSAFTFLVFLLLFGSGFAPASPPETFKAAFIGPDRNLYAWTPSGSTQKIFTGGDLSDLKISGDGSLIAFTRHDTDGRVSLWMCNFDGSNSREVMTRDDMPTLKTNMESIGAGPVNLRWIPGTHTLTFTSYEVFDGPGMVLNDDLITINGDTGKWNILLKPHHGGVAAFSPDGKWMALSTATNVSIMDVNGIPAPGPGLDFPAVLTYSEYQYYPEPVWAADSSRLAVFIPTDDPMKEPRGKSSIWILDTMGSQPGRQVQFTPQFIGPAVVSPDLAKFIYVREAGNPTENRRELRSALINGSNGVTVFSGEVPEVYGWTPDGDGFAFRASMGDPIKVSRVNGPVGDLKGTEGADWFRWVDPNRFLFTRVTGDTVELTLGDRKEGRQLMAALPVSENFRMMVDFVQ
jgi:Tol biopolymer transport system component